jgi:hypothetical protein
VAQMQTSSGVLCRGESQGPGKSDGRRLAWPRRAEGALDF